MHSKIVEICYFGSSGVLLLDLDGATLGKGILKYNKILVMKFKKQYSRWYKVICNFEKQSTYPYL